MPLTPKEALFVREYLIHRNATQAVKAARYKTVSPTKYGSELLTKPDIQAAIAEAEEDLKAQYQITNAKVIRELAAIAFFDIGEILDLTGTEPRLKPVKEITREARRAIGSFKTKRYLEGRGEDAREVEVTEFKACDKIKAIETLCTILGISETEDAKKLQKTLDEINSKLAGK